MKQIQKLALPFVLIMLVIVNAFPAYAYSSTATANSIDIDNSQSYNNVFGKFPDVESAYILFSNELAARGIITDLCYEDFLYGYQHCNEVNLESYTTTIINAEISASQSSKREIDTYSTFSIDSALMEARVARDNGTISTEESELLSAYEELLLAFEENGSYISISYDAFCSAFSQADFDNPDDFQDSITPKSSLARWYDDIGMYSPQLPKSVSYSSYNIMLVATKGDIV